MPEPAEMPPHFCRSLQICGGIQVGTPVNLLCKMNQMECKANGTILKILELRNNLIEAKIVNVSQAGDTMFIPCIKLLEKDKKSMPFSLIRMQFPMKPAFAMTITRLKVRP